MRSRSRSPFPDVPEMSREQVLTKKIQGSENDISWIKDDLITNKEEISRLEALNVDLQKQVEGYEKEIARLKVEFDTLK